MAPEISSPRKTRNGPRHGGRFSYLSDLYHVGIVLTPWWQGRESHSGLRVMSPAWGYLHYPASNPLQVGAACSGFGSCQAMTNAIGQR